MNVLGKRTEAQKRKRFSETRGMPARQSKTLHLVSAYKSERKLWFSISAGTVHAD